jgi:ketosteroid isomerase-like protein
MAVSHVICSSALAVLGVASPASGHPDAAQRPAEPARHSDSLQDPAATVDAFHAALARGDLDGAAALLSDDAVIFESGAAEHSKAEYTTHHLGVDASFAQAVPRLVMSRSGTEIGDMAWIATEGRTTGTYRDRAIDSLSKETMLLRKGVDGWKIVHIHWSSAKAN